MTEKVLWGSRNIVPNARLWDSRLSSYFCSVRPRGRIPAFRFKFFLALDGDGNVYITGYTESRNLSTTPGSYDTGVGVIPGFPPLATALGGIICAYFSYMRLHDKRA